MDNAIYSAVTEFSSQAAFAFDIETEKFIYTNPAFSQMFNTASMPLSAATAGTIIPDEDRDYLVNLYYGLLKGRTVQKTEFRIKKDDSFCWIRVMPVLVKTDTLNLIVGNAIDITEDTENLHVTEKYANKKNSILNMLQHDLTGPLAIANTLTQSLRQKDDQYLNSQVETISKINKQCIDLIRDLTDREFLETANVVLVKKRIDAVQVLKEYIAEYQKTEALSKRQFKFSSSSPEILINADESKFIQIMNNLITNSLKFTRDNGTVSLKIIDNKNTVLFSLSDDGIGIPEQYHSILFEKFTDARRKGLHGEPTAGVGLSIVKTLVEWHEGKIWFESKEGEGTVFFIEIPKV